MSPGFAGCASVCSILFVVDPMRTEHFFSSVYAVGGEDVAQAFSILCLFFLSKVGIEHFFSSVYAVGGEDVAQVFSILCLFFLPKVEPNARIEHFFFSVSMPLAVKKWLKRLASWPFF